LAEIGISGGNHEFSSEFAHSLLGMDSIRDKAEHAFGRVGKKARE